MSRLERGFEHRSDVSQHGRGVASRTVDIGIAIELLMRRYDPSSLNYAPVTDGSDDGFLYARGYIVALGKAFYDAVRANPEIAISDSEFESMCYLPAHVHEERFGGFPKTGSGISRETGSNGEGWADS
ncbi:MAG TPA: hypothetical protein VF403_24285 [Kofleriaceae bacterium]